MNGPMTWEEMRKIRARLEEGSLQVATTWPTILVMADRIGPEAETSVQLLAPDFMLSGMIGAAATSMYKVMGGQELTDEDRREPECAAAYLAWTVKTIARMLGERYDFDQRHLLATTAFLLLKESLDDEENEEENDGTADDDR